MFNEYNDLFSMFSGQRKLIKLTRLAAYRSGSTNANYASILLKGLIVISSNLPQEDGQFKIRLDFSAFYVAKRFFSR